MFLCGIMHRKLQQGFLDEQCMWVFKWKRIMQVQCLASSCGSQGSAELMQRLRELQVKAAAI